MELGTREFNSYLEGLWRVIVPRKYKNLLGASSLPWGESAGSPTWFWSPTKMQYITSTGNVLTGRELRFLRDTVVNSVWKSGGEVLRVSSSTPINIDLFRTTIRDSIKETSGLSSALAAGGWNKMTASDWGYVGAQVRSQYSYLELLLKRYQDGEISEESMISRAGNFIKDASLNYDRVYHRMVTGSGLFTMERRVVEDSKACSQCAEEASRGWVPLNSLSPIGNCQCYYNCRCHFEYM